MALAAKRKKRRHKIIAVLVVLVALIAVVAGLFCWQRWYRYNDAADIQGTWELAADPSQTVVIDSTNIDLVKGVAYKYTLNTQDKTITFTFSDKTGSGTYHFNGNRTQLVIDESGTQPNLLVQMGLQDDPAVANDTLDDNVTVLNKVSDDTQTHYDEASSSSDSEDGTADESEDTDATEDAADASTSSASNG